MGASCGFLHEGAGGGEQGMGGDMNGMGGDMNFMGGMPAAKRQRTATKTQACRHFAGGFCQMGDACNFAHGDHELGMPTSGVQVAPNMSQGGGGMQMPFNAPQAQNPEQMEMYELVSQMQQMQAAGELSLEDQALLTELMADPSFKEPQQQPQQKGGGKGGFQAASAAQQQQKPWGKGGGKQQAMTVAPPSWGKGSGNTEPMGELERLEKEMQLLEAQMNPGGAPQGNGYGNAYGKDSGKGGGKQYMKTKICNFFANGACSNGENCTYAHGEWELGTPQGEGKGGGKQAFGQQQQGPQVFMKTKVCTNFSSGTCARGENCTFAHGDHELGTPQPIAAPRQPGQPQGQGGFKKTKLCTNYTQQGFCPRGETCNFAHGDHELGTPQTGPTMGGGPAMGGQQQPRPQGFKKSKLCNNFAQGFCARAEACTFAHGEAELGTAQPAGSAIAPGGPKQFVKTKLCIHFQQQGSCSRGAGCGFAHGEHELGTPGVAPGPAGSGGPPGAPSSAEKELFNFKSSLCNNYIQTGACQRGDKCSFAHGEGELMVPGQAKSLVEQMESGPVDLKGY